MKPFVNAEKTGFVRSISLCKDDIKGSFYNSVCFKLIVFWLLLMLGVMNSAAFSKERRESVGLVLSGGGAKGIAHVGVIKALEDNDIPIDYVTGTSMGAIVGSLYSCGWSPEKMIKFFTAPDFLYWSSGTIEKSKIYYVDSPYPTPQWFNLNLGFKGNDNNPNLQLPANLISPLPMNIEFLKLYAPYSEQCGENFNNLFVPFRCVTSNIYAKEKN